MVWSGESEVMGSWKMIDTAPPRSRRIRRLSGFEGSYIHFGQALAPEMDGAGADGGGAGQNAHDRLRRHRFAGTRFPDQGHGPPREERRRTLRPRP